MSRCVRSLFPSFQEYVLVDSESTSVEIYRRGEGKMWLWNFYKAWEAIALESIEFQCHIELLYAGVAFEVRSYQK
ncbi:hypothetical protein [Okeania sp. SIO3I5]|uniref:hypothetical protein n=1 Tax=Okeania sp. SIO3I5 TaxID=2607805 RepID=UPI0025EBDA85|nr:hypothetical protein [Okeania sp. SIO3I5]